MWNMICSPKNGTEPNAKKKFGFKSEDGETEQLHEEKHCNMYSSRTEFTDHCGCAI
jgi:hypothetical protein